MKFYLSDFELQYIAAELKTSPMAPQETVRQHFVPRTYLKHFGFGAKHDKVFVLARDEKDASRIRSQGISAICYQNKLYTLPGASVKERMELENFYQSVENDYNRLQGVLTDGSVKTISPDERGHLLLTVGTMLHRTTRVLSLHNKVVDEVLEQMYRLAEMTGATSFHGGYSIVGKSLEEVQTEMRDSMKPQQVLTQLDVALRFVQERQDHYAFIVTELDEQAGDYIISDNPVWIFSQSEPATAFNPSASIRLPLGPKHMLNLQPIPDSYAPEIASRIWGHIIREFVEGDEAKGQRLTANLHQYENAERWLIGSKTELTRHVHERDIMQRLGESGEARTVAKLKALGLI